MVRTMPGVPTVLHPLVDAAVSLIGAVLRGCVVCVEVASGLGLYDRGSGALNGVVIARRGGGMRETFTVRRIVAGEGVERTFPVHSPKIAKLEVVRHGRVRRAKLFYLRGRVGKSTRLAERRPGKKQ